MTSQYSARWRAYCAQNGVPLEGGGFDQRRGASFIIWINKKVRLFEADTGIMRLFDESDHQLFDMWLSKNGNAYDR